MSVAANSKKVFLNFGRGKTTMLARLAGSSLEFLDYETDHKRIHETLGGEMTTSSEDNRFGEGFVSSLGEYFLVGTYQVDARPAWPTFVQFDKGLFIFVPWAPHKGIQREFPIVFVQNRGNGNLVVIYEHLKNALTTLEALMNGSIDLSGSNTREYERAFHRKGTATGIHLTFANLFKDIKDRHLSKNPWSFVTGILKNDFGLKPVTDVRMPVLRQLALWMDEETGLYYETVRLNGEKFVLEVSVPTIFPEREAVLHGWTANPVRGSWFATRESRNGDSVTLLAWNKNGQFVTEQLPRGVFLFNKAQKTDNLLGRLAMNK